MLRGWTLKTRLTWALLVSFVLIAVTAGAVARAHFLEVETHHARADAEDRAAGIARFIDLRFLTLGQYTRAAADEVGRAGPDAALEDMMRMGFNAYVVLGKDDEVLAAGGDADDDPALQALLVSQAPPRSYWAPFYRSHDGWLTIGARSTGMDQAVVGGFSHDYLTDVYLADALIDEHAANVLVLRDGEVLAASYDAPALGDLEGLDGGVLHTAEGAWLAESHAASTLDARLVRLIPEAHVESRVDALAWRFFVTSSVALIAAGGLTLLVVFHTLRHMGRITEAARRIGEGAETLDLPPSSGDEMGVLADALRRSAAAVAESRRRQSADAEAQRAAAEEFQLAVGGLSRAVGEADSRPEIARRLADALLRLLPSAGGVAVFHDEEVLEVRSAEPSVDGIDPGRHAIEALLASDLDAFVWVNMGGTEDRIGIAILPPEDGVFNEAEMRKVEILGAQASLALHRCQSTESLRQARDALDRSVREKQMFLDILGHDLKNPLAIARGRAELVARRHPEAAEGLKPIDASLQRATTIIEEAVLFSKLEAVAELERAEVDLREVAEEAVAAITPLGVQRGIAIAIEGCERMPWRANRLVARALENLLSNAVKWSPENSQVELRLEKTPASARLHVIDHGPGIPPEDRPRLFARFERADRTGVKGTGLGLAIAKRVVDMHEGAITIADTPGGGCTFTVDIPRRPLSPNDVCRPQAGT